MVDLLIYHHLGLGDHIVCNAIVRAYCAKSFSVTLICKSTNVPSVSAMFSDIKNLSIKRVENDNDAIKIYNNHYGRRLPIGYMNEQWDEIIDVPFDMQFYSEAEIPFMARWDNFGVMRKPENEAKLLTKLFLPKQFIFVHDDPDRDYNIDISKINSLLPIIRPSRNYTKNIIDYLAVMERAAEIHCINSSFLLLSDSVCLPGKKVFHKYARNDGEISNPSLKNQWEVLS